jgi:hypothetical protein
MAKRRNAAMKQLSVYSLALFLVVGTSIALAGDRYRGYPDSHYRGHENFYDHHSPHNYPPHRRYKQHSHRSYYRKGYSNHYHPRSHYFPAYFGAALIGSALTHSLYHMHHGMVCYDRH